ncbi:MAG: hypothetical protein ACKOC9_02940, partial [Alphaproteobacteria bacterium]
MSRLMRKVAGCAAAIMLVAGLVEAQQAPSPATAIADLYRPFTAPPGDRTRAQTGLSEQYLQGYASPFRTGKHAMGELDA